MKFCSLRAVMFACFTLSVAACGGGGGGGGDATPTPAPPDPPANIAPVVNAGVDQTVEEGASVKLTGTATDSDGTVASTLWTQVTGPTVSLTDRSSLSPSFTAPEVDSDT